MDHHEMVFIRGVATILAVLRVTWRATSQGLTLTGRIGSAQEGHSHLAMLPNQHSGNMVISTLPICLEGDLCHHVDHLLATCLHVALQVASHDSQGRLSLMVTPVTTGT